VATIGRRAYEVPGWGTGEVWVRGRTVLLHVLPGEVDPGEDVRARGSMAAGAELGPASSPREPGRGPASPEGEQRPPGATLSADCAREDHGFVTDLCARFALHLSGTRVDYADVRLDLGGRTPFEQELCRALRVVPWGEVVSYGELAALAGRPGAARAAGSFCASSDVALVVPCHRVVAAHGIGGYGQSGVALKRRLLELEGISL
jgi:O-6-methylguanine DNA methyltransferase